MRTRVRGISAARIHAPIFDGPRLVIATTHDYTLSPIAATTRAKAMGMYSVSDFGRMAADTVRMDAYVRAIEAAVKPGSIVLDLGAGTGIASLLAARLGAARVHAVDPNPAVWLIPELAAESSLSDRIVVHHASSLDMDPPERVDVVISDLRGPVPLVGEHLASMRDIRRRWLAPGGVILPARDELWVAVAEAEAFERKLADAETSFARFGFASSAVRRSIRNELCVDTGLIGASDIVSDAGTWATIEYATCDATHVEGTVELRCTRGGTARGLSIYFETELSPGIGFTTAPGHSLVYGRNYLPLDHAVSVAPGDRVEITVRADVRGERWAWDTTFFDSSGGRRETMKQATFLGAPISLDTLRRGSDKFQPELTRRGQRLREILGTMDGSRTVREIAESFAGKYAELDRAEDITDEIRSIAMRYGRDPDGPR
jgi:type I protein arginine methyltransferase